MTASSLDDSARGTRVLVTGATGYVAGWLVKRLLDAGAIVHAAVRDPSNTAKVGHLTAMAEQSPGQLTLFKGDLLEPGSYDAAMQGCKIVFHTASPFLSANKVTDPQKAFIEPAVNGTRNVLDSANRTPSVERVVLTSSGAAMGAAPAGGVTTEESWNTESTLEKGAYPLSKTLAERAAWEMAEAQNRWRLVVINPGLVLGEGLGEDQTSASFDMVSNMANGAMRDRTPPMSFGMVDVLDVAEAHFRAGFIPEAEGRHVLWQGDYPVGHIADVLKAEYGDRYPFPTKTGLPPGVDVHRADNSKSKRALGMTYRPIEPAILAMFKQLVRLGRLPAA